MRNLVRLKFRIWKDLAERLMNTGDAEIVYGNHRRDDYWGLDFITMKGQNKLGVILQSVRQELFDGKEN